MKFSQATAVSPLSSHTYAATFQPGWTIGSVPHGGYVTATFQQVVKAHFSTTLAKQNQPHTITAHLDFLRRTQTGPATFVVKDVKLGRQTSVVHVTLHQDDREEIVGYFTNSNLQTETGASFDTHWDFTPKPAAVQLAKLDSDEDALWGERKEWPFVDFRAVTTKIRSWFPRAGQMAPNTIDMWLSLRDPEDRFTQESLGFVADTFPQILESYAMGGVDTYSIEFEKKHSKDEQKRLMKGQARFWYPTLLLNLDVKKALPEAGAKYLFLRLQTKQIKNGRYDLEVVIRDAEGELVTLSHHVVLAVDAQRNLSARRKVDSKL